MTPEPAESTHPGQTPHPVDSADSAPVLGLPSPRAPILAYDVNTPAGLAAFRHEQKFQLGTAVVIVLAALLFTPAPPGGDRVSILGWGMPPSCPSLVFWNRPCPGCGLTRSFVAVAHAQFDNAVAFHRLGPVLFGAILLSIPYRLVLWRAGPNAVPRGIQRVADYGVFLLLGAMLVNWLLLLAGI